MRHPNPPGLHPNPPHPREDPAQDQRASATRNQDLHCAHHGPKAWKTPSRHPGVKHSPETACNKIIHSPSLAARLPTGRAGPKIHPISLAWMARDAAQSILQHKAPPCRAGGFLCTHTHIYTHMHKRIGGNLPPETKQLRKRQIRPSHFHPMPERTFAHGFTSKVAALRWSQLLCDLDGAARLAPANTPAP